MEEFLIVLLQFLLELTIEVVAYVGFDKAWKRDDGTGCLYYFFLILLAAGLAGLTNWIQPKLLLPNETQRVLNLLVTPLLIGGVVYWLAASRQSRGEAVSPLVHATTVGLFLLVYGLVRYAWGVH